MRGLHPAGLAPKRLLLVVLQLLFLHLPLVPESPARAARSLGSLGSWGNGHWWPVFSLARAKGSMHHDLPQLEIQCSRTAPALHSVLILAPSSPPCLQNKCLFHACQESCWLFLLSGVPHGMCTAAAAPALAIHSALAAFLAHWVLKPSFSP